MQRRYTKDFLKLVFLVDVIVILKHGEGKALAETARANEEEIENGGESGGTDGGGTDAGSYWL